MQRYQRAVEKNSGALSTSPHASVKHDQFNAVQAAFLEMAQKGAPPRLVLFGALDDAKDLAVAVGMERDRHQQ